MAALGSFVVIEPRIFLSKPRISCVHADVEIVHVHW